MNPSFFILAMGVLNVLAAGSFLFTGQKWLGVAYMGYAMGHLAFAFSLR